MMQPRVIGFAALVSFWECVLAMWLEKVPVRDGLTVGWVDTVQDSSEGTDTFSTRVKDSLELAVRSG